MLHKFLGPGLSSFPAPGIVICFAEIFSCCHHLMGSPCCSSNENLKLASHQIRQIISLASLSYD